MSTDGNPWRAPRRWRKRAWLVIGLLAVGTLAFAFVPDIGSPQDSGLRLTHRLKRGDLIVTVTEQGALESAENTEIKCKVRTASVPITWVIESGSKVKPGDVVVRLATLAYEDRLIEVSKWVHMTRSGAQRAEADVARAELAIPEYLEGRYQTELMTLEKDLAIAESNLRTAQNMLAHTETMAQRGYVSALDLERATFAVTQAKLNVGVKQTEISVLKDYAKAMELETLNGNLNAAKARFAAETERAKFLEVQLGLCRGDVDNCVVRAERSGIVIYPTGKPWEHVPEIEEGASIYMGQTMLLMPDLTKMQVKVGIRESYIDRMKAGLKARVALPNQTLDGEVTSVAEVTGPTGWWNGNTVRYDTIVKLPSTPGLMPGMSAEVEIIVAEHHDVLTIPVAAVVETAQGAFCWIKTVEGTEKRSLQLGDSNDRFTVVEAGLKEADEVMLNPLAIEEAKTLAQQASDESDLQDPNVAKSRKTTETGKKSKSDANSKPSGPKATEPIKNANKKQSPSEPVNFEPAKK